MGWYIYLIETLDTVKTCSMLILSILYSIIVIIYFFGGDRDINTLFKLLKKKIVLIFSIIFILLSIFIPNKKTSYTVVIMDKVMENNQNKSTDEIKELIDYTMDKIQK